MSEAFCGFLARGKPLPFEDLFIPLVLDARAGLRQKATDAQIALLRSEAQAGWERSLLRRISGAGSKAAFCQFQAFKTVRSVFSVAATPERRPADSLYREFVGDSPRKRLGKLFEEFPALFEYGEVLVANWIATVSEFLGRLEADRDQLDANFAGGPFTCPVVGLQADLSDPHGGGRCVARLTFESGASLIYKPRSVAPEARFSDLLEQFNTEAIPHSLRVTRCWERHGYGWMEDVVPHPCDTLAEVHAFYWRAGVLLALVYLSRGVDMHRENLVAAGASPVLVDLETLWHPQEHAGAADSPLAASVLRTGFLPQGNPQAGAIYEWSALGNRLDSSFPATVWLSINEDNMALERGHRPFQGSPHLPVFVDARHLARDFLPDILAGFRWIGERVLGNPQRQEKFLRWIQVLTRCPRRRILRSSLWYRKALEQLTAPPALRKKEAIADDLSFSAQADVLFTEAEWQALKQLEIPWLGQAAGQENDQDHSLPVQTMEEFLAQEPLITDAFAPS